jgi:hypothetical protein
LAERQGVEPCHRISTMYGLAIRCLTIRPTLLKNNRILFYAALPIELFIIVDKSGIEPETSGFQGQCFAVSILKLAEDNGIELSPLPMGWFSRPIVRHAPYPPMNLCNTLLSVFLVFCLHLSKYWSKSDNLDKAILNFLLYCWCNHHQRVPTLKVFFVYVD